MTRDEQLKEASKKILDKFDELVKSDLSKKSKILDIGFGSGKFLYRLYHKFGISNLIGIDSDSIEELEATKSYYLQCIENYELVRFINNAGIGKAKYKLDFYEFYRQYVRFELNDKEIEKDAFSEVFRFIDKTKFKKEVFEKQKFDFIILSRIIHYSDDIKSVNRILEESIQLLNNQGILYISFPIGFGEIKITEAEFDKVLNNNPKIRELKREKIFELNKEIMIYEGIKNDT